MSEMQTVTEIVAALEAQSAFHREREAFHAAHEAQHREQRSAHAAELEQITRRLEAFRAAAAEALELAKRSAAQPSRDDKEDLGSASRPKLGRMVERVSRELMEVKGPEERFGPVGLAQEINRRFGHRLRRPVTPGQVSVVLRRLLSQGRLQRVRAGRPHWEALYVWVDPAIALAGTPPDGEVGNMRRRL